MGDRRRTIAFVLFAAACLAAAAVSVAVAVRGRPADAAGARAHVSAAARRAAPNERRRPLVLFARLDRHSASPYGHIATAELRSPATTRRAGPFTCARVAWGGDHGICLVPVRGITARTSILILGRDWRVEREVYQPGVPSRARVSPDGRLAATTLFVVGHSYAAAGAFSTATTLFDVAHGRTIGNLESFTAYDHGRAIHAADINYWGVTFARDGRTFYATLATGGRHYLVRGDIPTRRVTVLRDNVECPSLSPDGTRIAYKKTVGQPKRWRFTVLDLRTMRDTLLAERRPVDDQVAWLDDHTVLYGQGGTVFAVPADGSGAPRVFLRAANSPVVVR